MKRFPSRIFRVIWRTEISPIADLLDSAIVHLIRAQFVVMDPNNWAGIVRLLSAMIAAAGAELSSAEGCCDRMLPEVHRGPDTNLRRGIIF
ncbi:hypothetical protein BGAL_0452g00030 [Botrytis galanthina]|uniref:Uncharacterized protein n=1 Tax=Botrytis galanthina TaxID=278940 RepID=A0A4S8QL91_9HELO|nr:hypothetical protein BGAL_0452g00030 [Botrytis galanthina]